MGEGKWEEGFEAGVLCCLAVIADNDGPGSTIYLEVVSNCGPLKDLIAAAERDGDGQLRHLQKIAADRESASRRRGSAE